MFDSNQMHCILTLWDFLFCVTQENKKKTHTSTKVAVTKLQGQTPKYINTGTILCNEVLSACVLNFSEWTGLSTQKQRFHTFLYHETDNGGAKTFDPGCIAGGWTGYACCLFFLLGWPKRPGCDLLNASQRLYCVLITGTSGTSKPFWLRSPSLFWSSGLYCIETLLWLSHVNAANYRSRCETFGSVLVHL